MHLPIRKRNQHFPVASTNAGDHRFILLLIRQAIRFRQVGQVEHPLSDQVLALHTHAFLIGTVDSKETGIGTLVKHRVGNGIDECTLKIGLVLQMGFHLLSITDVLQHPYGRSGITADPDSPTNGTTMKWRSVKTSEQSFLDNSVACVKLWDHPGIKFILCLWIAKQELCAMADQLFGSGTNHVGETGVDLPDQTIGGKNKATWNIVEQDFLLLQDLSQFFLDCFQ